MIYVIEGLDATGKTTLAEAISEETNIPILALSHQTVHNDWIDDMISARTLSVVSVVDVIYDRTIVSGLTYTFDGPMDEAIERMKEWNEYVSRHYVLYIYLFAADSVRQQRDPDGWDVPTKMNMHELSNHFAQLADVWYSFNTADVDVLTIIESLRQGGDLERVCGCGCNQT